MAKKKNFMDRYQTYDTKDGYGSPEQWQQQFKTRIGQQLTAAAPGPPDHAAARQLLGVTPQASADQLKKAYRRLLMQWHPDHNAHQKELADQMTRSIIAAYELLTQ